MCDWWGTCMATYASWGKYLNSILFIYCKSDFQKEHRKNQMKDLEFLFLATMVLGAFFLHLNVTLYRRLEQSFRARCERKKTTLLEDYKSKMFSAFIPNLCCLNSQSQNVEGVWIISYILFVVEKATKMMTFFDIWDSNPKINAHSWSLKGPTCF